MKLRNYLKKNKITVEEFAEDIEVTRTYLSGFLNGRVNFSRKLATRIEKITKKKVRIRDILLREGE